MIAATLGCAMACALLVFAEWKAIAWLRVAAKLTASLAFVAVAVLASRLFPCSGIPQRFAAYGNWMIAGLALGVVGDVALLGGNRAFLVGLGAFLLGHLAYVVGMAQLVTPLAWFADAQLAALLPVAVAALAVVKLWPKLGSMRVPVIIYVIAIVAMVIGAFAVLRQDTGDVVVDMLHRRLQLSYENRSRLAVGAILFFASDLAVAREKFLVRSLSNRALGLPAYYAGQLFIAWSLS